MNIFLKYPWEGNVRELENLLEGIMSIQDMDIIEIEHLPAKFKTYKVNKAKKNLFFKGNFRRYGNRFDN